jgi:hypothetical protein
VPSPATDDPLYRHLSSGDLARMAQALEPEPEVHVCTTAQLRRAHREHPENVDRLVVWLSERSEEADLDAMIGILESL